MPKASGDVSGADLGYKLQIQDAILSRIFVAEADPDLPSFLVGGASQELGVSNLRGPKSPKKSYSKPCAVYCHSRKKTRM